MADADLEAPYIVPVRFGTPIGELYAYGSPMARVKP